jgi:tRNA(fMet)-specific endonuclease VapC
VSTTFLDTDVCIAILRGKDPSLESKLRELPITTVEIPSVVIAELWVGVCKSENPSRAESKLELFMRDLQITPFDESAARKYGQIRADLERRGVSIGENDLLIAATVINHGGRLITRNHREYAHVQGLRVETW